MKQFDDFQIEGKETMCVDIRPYLTLNFMISTS